PKYTRQGFKTTFRVVADDTQLGGTLGKYAVETLKGKNIAVIDDRTAYGQGVAEEFEKSAKAAGATIVGHEFTTDKSTDFNAILTKLKASKPDVLFFIYNDHVSSFFFDHYSAFSLGVGERHEVADEGGGARDLPPLSGHPALARHIGRSLVADEFDMSFFQDRALDHGVFSPMSLLCPHEPAWPIPVVTLQVGVLQSP
ncbi:ABC transporter substrate-binding protein, partial [Variovorax sp. RHLX14]|uniref:DODA-type extradiol aromatic ring-opening family dioxygenase n=1 Tax=Variovorax sp. RHLX14 TaxID=1259731 RepID=UPI003F44E753